MENGCIFAPYLEKQGFVAQLDRASDYESEGLRFESPQGHYLIFIFKIFYNV